MSFLFDLLNEEFNEKKAREYKAKFKEQGKLFGIVDDFTGFNLMLVNGIISRSFLQSILDAQIEILSLLKDEDKTDIGKHYQELQLKYYRKLLLNQTDIDVAKL